MFGIIKNGLNKFSKDFNAIKENNLKNVADWFKKQGVPKKYQDRILYCGYYDEYIKQKNVG